MTVVVLALIASLPGKAHALIRGGEGSEPINDPGWPTGAAAVFNTKTRVAWWEGPPYGGGQWHSECRGDADKFNEALEAFAKIDGRKRVVVHDGIGSSFWLNTNREPAKKEAAKIDWVFVVWQRDRWERLRKMPADLRPPDLDDDDRPVPQIDVYAGGSIDWSDVKVPQGIDVIDDRLEAHGFSIADGVVLEGKVVDLATQSPLAATMRLERIEPQPAGGYRYQPVGTAQADASGRWVMKNAPAGWHRIVVESDGYVARIAGYGQFDAEPRWSENKTGLARPAPVAGVISDADGRPLAGADVRLRGTVDERGDLYEPAEEFKVTTGAEGRFRFDRAPKGKATISLHKPGYVRPGLGPEVVTPIETVALQMMKAARLVVTVNFLDATRPAGYIVKLAPEKGDAIGSWGGSGNVDAAGTMRFENVPPGKYVVTGRPNPGSDDEETEPVVVKLRGGETTTLGFDPK